MVNIQLANESTQFLFYVSYILYNFLIFLINFVEFWYYFRISDGAELLPSQIDSLEATLVTSYKCYEKALLLEPLEVDRNNLLRRLGNIHNELGVLYMNQAGGEEI